MIDYPLNDCPFCIENNLLKSKIISQTKDAILIENIFYAGNFLIIPKAHVTEVQHLPNTFWAEIKELLRAIPGLGSNYNISLNIGELAGQTQPHLHFWVIPRTSDSKVVGKGLLGLIKTLQGQLDAQAED